MDLLAAILNDPRLGSQERSASYAIGELKNYIAKEPRVSGLLSDYLATLKGKDTALHQEVSDALLTEFPTSEGVANTLGRLWRQSFNRDFAPSIGFTQSRGGFHHDQGAVPAPMPLSFWRKRYSQ